MNGTIRAHRLVAGLGGHRTEPIDLTVDDDRIVALVGPSGSGKTTVLKTLGGVVAPIAGSVEHTPAAPIVCFQEARLLPWRTAIANVAFGLGRPSTDSDTDRAERLLGELGIDADQTRRRPRELSGGQQRRVAIARAIFAARSTLLVDEPFAHLDEHAARLVIDALHRLVVSGVPVGVAVHSEHDADRIADMIVHVHPAS